MLSSELAASRVHAIIQDIGVHSPLATPRTRIMRGGAGLAGGLLAGICGVFTAYTALQPALKEGAEKRAGTFREQHEEENKDNVLSQAIISDLKEAKKEVNKYDNGGFAWGIRKALFGPKPPHDSPSLAGADANTRDEKDR
ncbi:hypothetical protein AC579_9552 [Pseudocercospora musae]|uniref:Uncharacterized protein n=1 Tax=Pseudocercospora musae TaxID=113226 RepID=A0A139IIX5_9PEZI|nr:hypothetical protein AC579_9552 [Pseudocercospora musae]